MKRLLPLPAILTILLLSLTPAGRSPSVVSAQANPSAQQLLNRMQGAIASKRTVHLVMAMSGSQSQVSKVSTRVTADISTGSHVAIEHIIARVTILDKQAPTTTSQDVTLVLVNTHAAIKLGSKGWQCGKTQTVIRQYGDIFASLIPQVRSPKTVGAVTANGVGVWHVRATTGASVPGQSIALPTDFYISRADSTLIEETSSGVMQARGQTVRESLTMLFSHYGEHVNARMPAACLSKG